MPAAKRPPGRPPRGARAAVAIVKVRVLDSERASWEKAAGNRSLSEWIREACEAHRRR